MKSTILFLACNRLSYTKASLEILLRNTPSPYKLVLGDAGSVDGTKEYFQSIEKSQSNVEVLYYSKNYGPHRIRSHFLHRYLNESKFLGCVSNDLKVTSGWLSAFEELLEKRSEVGIVGPVDRDWGSDQLVTGSIPYYGGTHFHWSDGYWLMRSCIPSRMQRELTIRIPEGTFPHPGFFLYNSVPCSQAFYWNNIRDLGYVTACHPRHGMEFLFKDTLPENAEDWHRKYVILSKYIYCKYPEKYAKDTSGTIRFTFKGKEYTYDNEPEWVSRTPLHLMRSDPNALLAAFDNGVISKDLSMLSDDQWMNLTMSDVFRSPVK